MDRKVNLFICVVLIAVLITGCSSTGSIPGSASDFSPEGNLEVVGTSGRKATFRWYQDAEKNICVFELSFFLEVGSKPSITGWGYNSDNPGKVCTQQDLVVMMKSWNKQMEEVHNNPLSPWENELFGMIIADLSGSPTSGAETTSNFPPKGDVTVTETSGKKATLNWYQDTEEDLCAVKLSFFDEGKSTPSIEGTALNSGFPGKPCNSSDVRSLVKLWNGNLNTSADIEVPSWIDGLYDEILKKLPE